MAPHAAAVRILLVWSLVTGFLRVGGLAAAFYIRRERLGTTGSMAEASINPTSLIGGFWVFVYGLMVYLPACTVPGDRPAAPPRSWHYPVAVVLPFPFVVLAAPMILLRQWLGIELFPGT
jgi:hypothetical protein